MFDRSDKDNNDPKNEEHQCRRGLGLRQYLVAATRLIPDWNTSMVFHQIKLN